MKEAVLFEDLEMPAGIICGAGTLREPELDRALSKLSEALGLLDEIGARPDIGARLQGVIDDIEASRSAGARS